MNETLKLSAGLAATCAVAASVLAFANWKTEGPRKAAELRQRKEALALVLPAFANDPLSEKTISAGVTFYPARDTDGKLLGVAGEGSTNKGFGGELKTLVGFSSQGNILTVLITSHKETPGLGTQATDRKEKKMLWDLFKPNNKASGSGLPPCPYLDQYAGKHAVVVGASAFKVVKGRKKKPAAGNGPTAGIPPGETSGGSVQATSGATATVQAVSGATVTSRAVADAVSKICAAYVSTAKSGGFAQ